MSDTLKCPKCGKNVRKGSTFCMGCGARLEGNLTALEKEETLEGTLPDMEDELSPETSGPEEDSAVLPDLDDSTLPPVTHETDTHEPNDQKFSWDSEALDDNPISTSSSRYDSIQIEEEDETDTPSEEPEVKSSEKASLSWDVGQIEERESSDVKEGMPFKEVAPPKVFSYDLEDVNQDAIRHVLPEEEDATLDAVAHLFPSGRGMTSSDFIDVVVGKPEKVTLKQPLQELKLAACPNCGTALNEEEDFQYPPFVFEAMGKARIEFGEKKLEENDHKRAIEEFEKAKVFFEQANNEKLVDEAMKKIDEGYDRMAKYHYDQAEQHAKDGQFEWAIVQYKKAREHYMLTSDTKMRSKCAEKARDLYVEWGKSLESEGDNLAKSGQTREALEYYRKAAEKYREGDDSKKLSGLEKKIRKA